MKSKNFQENERLLTALAEHMKLPLMQIARSAELARMTDDPAQPLEAIELTADSALKLLDNYLLSARIAGSSLTMELEPVSVAGVLDDVAHELSTFAREYGAVLQVHLAGKYEPVMAHRIGLEAALSSLGRALIEAQTAQPDQQRPIVKLGAHRGKKGIVAGVFSNTEGLSTDVFRRARQLYGRARQPLTQLTAGSGTEIFVAESILSAMSARLRVAHHQKLSGLAANFMPSTQLELVGKQ